MRISASVSSLQIRDLAPAVNQLDRAGVNFYHLDSIESREIFEFAGRLRKLTKTPFDLHLITSDPIKYWSEIREHNIQEVTIQLETLHSPFFVPADLRDRVGVAVLANRPAEFFKLYMETAPSLLLMTTTPGISGGKFQQEQFANIMRYRILYPQVPITVDGGVIPSVSSVLSLMGISQIVSGSYLFKGESIDQTVSLLRTMELSDWRLDEVLLPEPEILHQFSLRVPEKVSFINKEGVIEVRSVQNNWLDSIAAKTVSSDYFPFPVVWANEELGLDLFKKGLQELNYFPQMAITINSSDEVSGVFSLQNFISKK
ncbi:MAG: hypothetical protein WED33_02295 [Bacteroidia bacterium]